MSAFLATFPTPAGAVRGFKLELPHSSHSSSTEWPVCLSLPPWASSLGQNHVFSSDFFDCIGIPKTKMAIHCYIHSVLAVSNIQCLRSYTPLGTWVCSRNKAKMCSSKSTSLQEKHQYTQSSTIGCAIDKTEAWRERESADGCGRRGLAYGIVVTESLS